MNAVVELTKALIACPSVTPKDSGCQALIEDMLTPLGFVAERLPFETVDNLWLTHGSGEPLFVFLGHTDVVPAGPIGHWDSDPFYPEIRDGYLYGRGAADMKSGVAAFTIALQDFIEGNPDHPGTIAMLLTSDEEGDAIHGSRRVVDHLEARKQHIKWCLVGEPSAEKQLGDTIKNGRRGSLNATLKVLGTQGHIAYPELADNPIHKLLPALQALCTHSWDNGNAHYPPTSFQISNIKAGEGVPNVIPGTVQIQYNYRFSTASTAAALKKKCEDILEQHDLDYEVEWTLSGEPFLTAEGELLDAVCEAVKSVTGITPNCSTGGGTSDGRFIAPGGAEVVELGVVNASMHKLNEHVSVDELTALSAIYHNILERLMGGQHDNH